jgi:hypothetical protein
MDYNFEASLRVGATAGEASVGTRKKNINPVLRNLRKKQMPNVVNVRHSHYTLRHLQT